MQDTKDTIAHRYALKTKIIEAAMVAFAERGVRAVKMDDVARKMGISKRTLYEIFEDKEELLYQGVKLYDQQQKARWAEYMQQASTVMDIIVERYRQKVREVHKVCPQFYVDIVKYPKICQYLAGEREKNHESFLHFMQRGVDEGYFRSDVNYELVAHLFDAIGEHVTANEMMKRYSMEELFTSMLLVSLRGFCTSKGLKVLSEMLP